MVHDQPTRNQSFNKDISNIDSELKPSDRRRALSPTTQAFFLYLAQAALRESPWCATLMLGTQAHLPMAARRVSTGSNILMTFWNFVLNSIWFRCTMAES